MDSGIELVDRVLTASVHALAVQSGALVAKVLLLAYRCFSYSARIYRPNGASGESTPTTTTTFLTLAGGKLGVRRAESEQCPDERTPSSACNASHEGRHAWNPLDPSSSDAKSTARLRPEIPLYSTLQLSSTLLSLSKSFRTY